MNNNDDKQTTVPVEELLADIWQRTNRAEALLTVILRTQAEILSKTSGVSLEEALERINEDIREEFEAMEGEEEGD